MSDPADPTERMHMLANRHAQECMAAVGREMMRGPVGWQFGKDPQSFIREAIMNALQEMQNV